jgi:hypothetical protein
VIKAVGLSTATGDNHLQTDAAERRNKARDPKDPIDLKMDIAFAAYRKLIQAAEDVKRECQEIVSQIREDKS